MPVETEEAVGEGRIRRLARWALGAVFIGAGLLHFTHTEVYLPIVPPAFPAPRLLVLVSGAFEVLGGLGVLLAPPVRRWAGWGLTLLLVAVFPANVYMAIEGIGLSGPVGEALLWLRLPIQAVLIAWALWASGAWATARGTTPGTRPQRRAGP